MQTRLFAFDFDGTLVDSAQAKRRAFDEIFPQDCRSIVAEVLNEAPDASRSVVIPEIVARCQRDDLKSDKLIGEYGVLTRRLVSEAPEIEGALDAVLWAGTKGHCVLFSMTHHADLEAQIDLRGWRDHFASIHGFPAEKPETLRSILAKTGISAEFGTVIGDGQSDREAAERVGCRYLLAAAGWPDKLMTGWIDD